MLLLILSNVSSTVTTTTSNPTITTTTTSIATNTSGVNILSLEERSKEIQRQLFFFKFYAHSVDLNFIVPLKPEAEKKENFIRAKQGVFIDLFLNQSSAFTPFGHVPFVMVF